MSLGPEATAVPLADRALRVAAIVEPVSLLVLLANLATVHAAGVSAAVGPLHGTAYLVAIVSVLTGDHSRRVRLLAWIPAVGAILAVRAQNGGGRRDPAGD